MEQHLKIYIDTLEEKVQKLENQGKGKYRVPKINPKNQNTNMIIDISPNFIKDKLSNKSQKMIKSSKNSKSKKSFKYKKFDLAKLRKKVMKKVNMKKGNDKWKN